MGYMYVTIPDMDGLKYLQLFAPLQIFIDP